MKFSITKYLKPLCFSIVLLFIKNSFGLSNYYLSSNSFKNVYIIFNKKCLENDIRIKSKEQFINWKLIPVFDTINKFPSITFRKEESKISKLNRVLLNSIAKKLKANPKIKISINGYSPACYKRNFAFERIKNTIKYLVDKLDISGERIITNIEVGDGVDMNKLYIKEEK